MANSIRLKRGATSNLPNLKQAEPAFCTDTGSLHIGNTDGNVEFPPKSWIDAQLSNKANLNLLPNCNLLDNWYFLDPVNQRGEKEYTTVKEYTIDRWYLVNGTASLTNRGITLQKGRENTYVEFHIRLEGLDLSLPYTLSAIVDGELKSVSGKISDVQHALAARGWDGDPTNRIEAYLSAVLDNIVMVRFVFVSGTHLIQAAKLELGEHQTLAHQDASGNWVLNDPPPNKALELMKCQRYQLILPNRTDFSGAVGVGSSWDASSVQIDIPLPSELMKPATATLTGNWALRGAGIMIGINLSNAVVSGTTMPNVFNLDIRGLANLVPNECYELHMADSTAKLIIDANI